MTVFYLTAQVTQDLKGYKINNFILLSCPQFFLKSYLTIQHSFDVRYPQTVEATVERAPMLARNCPLAYVCMIVDAKEIRCSARFLLRALALTQLGPSYLD